MKKSKAVRDNLYTIIIFSAGGRQPAKWHNIELDKPAVRKHMYKAIRRLFPDLSAINVYQGVSRRFVEQIPRKEIFAD